MFLLNQTLFPFFYAAGHHNAFSDVLAIFFAEWLPYLLVLAFLVLVYYQKGWRRKVYLFCEAALAIILARGIVTTAIQCFYHEPRPFSFYNFTPLISETGWSFPSAHAAWFFALALVIWFANRKWGWWFFALAVLMGLARIYAGVHWPMDVVGGAAVGLLCAWFVHWLLRGSRKGLDGA
ncbi:MAG: phosphatase PAP2 family protein [Minisyncoccia bacterium]|jgi:undecaprenyl-diphosphatase